ncbi:MAG: sulfate ABC transporter substrate-binding protein [Hyphomonadaceae bacterium]
MPRFVWAIVGVAIAAGAIFLAPMLLARRAPAPAETPQTLVVVSYDATRELFESLNQAFARGHPGARIAMSHGGSGAQARAVLAGLRADVALLASAYDIDRLAQAGLVNAEWPGAYPQNATPFYSTVVLVVRAGNPRNIRDWNDLVREDVSVITPNPHTSGGGRWNYLAAWAYAAREGGEDSAHAFVTRLYANAPVMDSGARAAATTFTQRNIGDVLIAWESEAYLALAAAGEGRLEIVTPSLSIRAEPPVALIARNAEAHGMTELADAYIRFLYTPAAQEIAAQHNFRPTDASALAARQYPAMDLVTVESAFGGWEAANAAHFASGAAFDQIMLARDDVEERG